jgi:type IV pilus assembly protein PilE
MSMKFSQHITGQAKSGFSLVELMIAVAVVAILVTLSYPSYIHFVLRANRSDAQMTLQDWSNQQVVWRADHPAYNTGINPSNTDKYTYSMVSTTTSFTLTATAIGRQVADEQDGVSCATVTLRQDGAPGPDGHQLCWGK